MTIPSVSLETLVIVLGGAVVLLVVWLVLLERKLRKFMLGKNGANLEDTIVHIKKGIEHQRSVNKEIGLHMASMDERIQGSIRGVSTVRFNPFKGAGGGGNQSFATALVDERGDGVIISTLYGRERFSAFAKPLSKGESSFELTTEEKRALDEAIKMSHTRRDA